MHKKMTLMTINRRDKFKELYMAVRINYGHMK